MSKFFHISILKTLLINIRYFGLKGLLHLPIIVARNVQFIKLKGKISIDNIRPNCINIGFSSVGFRNQSSLKGSLEINGTLIVHNKLTIAKGASLVIGENGVLEIGSLFINVNSSIICYKKILFGNDCFLSWDSIVMDTDFHHIICEDKIINEDSSIIIGNHVWICMKVTILKGSDIPSECIISANSTINKRLFEQNCIYSNNQCIKKEVSWIP